MEEIKIGIVTDSHMGGFDGKIVDALKGENVDIVAYLGDAPEKIDATGDTKFADLSHTLTVYNKIEVPVFWIPGNYEPVIVYHDVFKQLGETVERLESDIDNIIDASRLGIYTYKKGTIEVDLAFVPGTRDFSTGFVVDGTVKTGDYRTSQGSVVHVFNPYDLKSSVKRPGQTIVLAHNPIQMNGDETFDVAIRAILDDGNEIIGPRAQQLIQQGRAKPKKVHAGNELLGKIIDDIGIKKVLAGDIHSAAYTTDRRGTRIPEGTFSQELFGNPGAAKDGKYGVMVYREDHTATLFARSVANK